MSDDDMGGARPADIRPGTVAILTRTTDITARRRAARALDDLLGVVPRETVTPNWDDFALGFEERRARGIELLERAA